LLQFGILILFFVAFPLLMNKKSDYNENFEKDRAINSNRIENPNIQYVIDCEEKQKCMYDCKHRSIQFSYTRYQNLTSVCLKECSKIICLNPKN